MAQILIAKRTMVRQVLEFEEQLVVDHFYDLDAGVHELVKVRLLVWLLVWLLVTMFHFFTNLRVYSITVLDSRKSVGLIMPKKIWQTT